MALDCIARELPVVMMVLRLLAVLLAFNCTVRADDPRVLRLLCWSEYVPQAVIDGFEAKTGTEISVENYNSNEQMLEKLRAKPGFYDLIQPSGFYVERLAKEGGLEPLDQTRIPNTRHLDPKFRRLAFDPEGRFSVPWLAGTVGIVVNTERVKEPVQDWADVFSGKYTGRIVTVDDAREFVTWALASMDLPITDVSDATLARVEPVLEKWLPQVKVFDSDSPKTAMLDGSADVGIVWSGEAALLWQAHRKFQYVLPRRGAHMFVDNLAIPKAAPHKDLAEEFINYCLKPEVSVLISNAYPYTNPNLAARRLLTQEQLSNPASYLPGDPALPTLRNEGNTTEKVSVFVRGIRDRLRKGTTDRP